MVNSEETLRRAEVLGSKLARSLAASKPRLGSSGYRTWQIETAFRVSNLVARTWFKLSGYQFDEGDDYSVVIDGRRVTVEVKASLTNRDPPWPVSKGMGGWQRERRRGEIRNGASIVVLQVAVKADASVKARVTPLTLNNVPEGRCTASYKRNVAYYMKTPSGREILKEILGEETA